MAQTLPRRLPFGVTVVAFGFLLNALLFALVLAGIRPGTAFGQAVSERFILAGPMMIGLIFFSIAAALLLLRRHPIGWVVAMLLVLTALVGYLIAWWVGTPEYLRMAIYTAMAFYLNQREVRAAFAWRPSSGTLPPPPPEPAEA